MIRLLKKKNMPEKKDNGILFKCEKLQKINKRLNCETFYYNARKKRKILKKFVNKKQQIVIAINTFRIGINVVDIKIIVHVNEVKMMLDYARENT